ncbi:MAG: sulfatase-like hydrolase/transferase [bacterium]|nr:sulfatase-like hydrolase/transferase [bacterium]
MAIATGCGVSQPPPIQHVVLVVFDTLRADRMSVYGHEVETTPFFKSAQAEMVRYADVKATAPWTLPSHASLFTGLQPSDHGAQWGWIALDERHLTIAEILSEQGFETVSFTANGFLNKRLGFAQGFSRHEVIAGNAYEKTEKILSRLPPLFAEFQDDEQRLFLYLNFMDNHIPYSYLNYGREYGLEKHPPIRTATEKWDATSKRLTLDEAEITNHRRAYDASVRVIDDVAAKIISHLTVSGLLDQTLVVFTSDHGDGLGYHQEFGHSVSIWEEQLDVPLILRFPNGWSGGRVVEDPTSLIAFTPTVLDWLGLPRPDKLADVPTFEEIKENEISAEYRSYFSELKREFNLDMLTQYPELAKSVTHEHVLYCGEFKLIVNPRPQLKFFNLTDDPNELNDLAPNATAEMANCVQRYRELRALGQFTPFEKRHTIDELENVKQKIDISVLRSLGYVQ